MTPDQARREARRILGEVAAGRDPAGERRAKREQARRTPETTVRAVAEEWLRRDQGGNRTAAEVRRGLDREILPAWGERPLASIRKRDVIALIDGIADRGAPIAANRALAYVKRLFNRAAGRDLVDVNPAQVVQRPAPERRRDRVLDDVVLSFTGRRPLGNLGHLKAELDRRILAGRLAVDLEAKRMPRWTIHDLRRSVATGLQRLGVRLEAIEAVLGHVSGSRAGVVGVYQRHRFEAEAWQALGAWARHLERLLAGESAQVVALRPATR